MNFVQRCQCTRPDDEDVEKVEREKEKKEKDVVKAEPLLFGGRKMEPEAEVPKGPPIKFETMPGQTIGIRTQPAFFSARTGDGITGEFEVLDILVGDEGQRHLRLADGRGWVFTMTLGGEVIAHEAGIHEPTPIPSHPEDESSVTLVFGVPGAEERSEKRVQISGRPVGLVYNVPPQKPAFEVTAPGDVEGAQVGWTLLGVGAVDLTGGVADVELNEAAKKLLAALPVQVCVQAPSGEATTVLVARRPVGMEIAQKEPFAVSAVTPGGHAAELGISEGMVVTRIGNITIMKMPDRDLAIAEFTGLPFQDAQGQLEEGSGLPYVVASKDGKTEKTFFLQLKPLAFSFGKAPPFAVQRVQPSAKAVGIEKGHRLKSVGKITLASAADADAALALVATLDGSARPPPKKGGCVVM